MKKSHAPRKPRGTAKRRCLNRERSSGSVKRVVSQRIFDKCRDAVPTSWLDPLLSGSKAVVGEPPYKPKDIVALCEGIRDRILALANKEVSDGH